MTTPNLSPVQAMKNPVNVELSIEAAPFTYQSVSVTIDIGDQTLAHAFAPRENGARLPVAFEEAMTKLEAAIGNATLETGLLGAITKISPKQHLWHIHGLYSNQPEGGDWEDKIEAADEEDATFSAKLLMAANEFHPSDKATPLQILRRAQMIEIVRCDKVVVDLKEAVAMISALTTAKGASLRKLKLRAGDLLSAWQTEHGQLPSLSA